MTARAPETLETARLVLRRPVAEDARPLFERYGRDPEVTRFMTWTTHENIERAHTFLRRCEAVWTDGSAFPWIITLDGELIGSIEVGIDGHRAEIGYALARAHWGRGYASEAACAVVDWALTVPEVRRVWAYHDVENVPSGRILETTGMTREGRLRAWFVPPSFGVPRDCWMYGRVKDAGAPVVARPSPPAVVAATPAAPPARRGDPEILETKRLRLRRPSVADAEAVFEAYAQDPDVSRYTTWAPHARLDDTRGFLRECERWWERGTVLSWAITRREDGRLIGMTDIRFEGHRAEIGYVLAREACLRAWAVMPAFGTARDVWCYAAVKEAA